MAAAAGCPQNIGEDDGDRFISHLAAQDYAFSLIENIRFNVTQLKPEHFMRRMGQLDLLI